MYKFNAFNNSVNTMAFFNCFSMLFYSYSVKKSNEKFFEL